MLDLFFVRHGESVRNYASRLAHCGDVNMLEQQLCQDVDESAWPLTILGREQSLAAGQWLKLNVPTIDSLYSSPYVRTLQTAAALDLGLEPIVDERLREREWGDYEVGAYHSTEYIKDLRYCNSFDWKSRFPHSESIADLVCSSAQFIEELADKGSGAHVIVTHGGRMLALEYALEGKITDRRHTNCCIVHYRLSNGLVLVRTIYPAQLELQTIDWQPVRAPALV